MSDWGKVPREVFMDSRLTRQDIRVLGILCAAANGKTGICTRNQKAISDEIDGSREGVNRSIKKLVSLGYVQTIARPGMKRSLQYRVLISDGSAGQLGLFDAHEAPRAAKPKRAKGDGKVTSAVTPEVTSVVTSEVTAIEQTLVNRTEPAGSLAQPREREVANDHRPEPVPTRTEQQAGAVPPMVDRPAGAVPPVRLNVEAVPFLPDLPAARDRSDLDALQDRLEAAAGSAMDPTAGTLGDTSAVLRWIVAGCDLEHDILPAIAGRAARHKGRGIRSWGYFEQPVLEAHQRRLAIMARTASATTIIPFDPKGASHGASSRFDPEPVGGRFAAAAARRRRGVAGGSSGGEDH